MSVTHVILGLLSEQPMHGYELKTAFDERYGTIWNLNYGQVYPALDKMKENGWIHIKESIGGRDKKVCSITSKGILELDRWLINKPDPLRINREEIFMRIAIASYRGRQSLTNVIHQQRHMHQITLAELINVHTSLDVRKDIYSRLVCEAAILRIEAELKWLDQVEEQIPTLIESNRSEYT